MVTEIKLGLGEPPYPVYLYVDKEEANNFTYSWHHWEPKQKIKTLVPQRSLTGYISELRLTSVDFKGKDNMKLDIVVFADQLYIVRSGVETMFTKSFLLAASLIEDFTRPITIVANPGDEKVVFCSVFDAQTRSRIRYKWDTNADFASMILDIQSRLSFTTKYDLDDEDISGMEQPSTVKSQSKAPASKSKTPPPVHPQDARVRQIRILLDYPVDLIKEWLQFQDVKAPSQLPQASIDELVKTMCLAWAADKADPYRGETTYQQQVLTAIASGTDEVTAIKAWMNYVVGQRAAVAAR
ncbi:hypothetical protein [Nostoc sp. MS1]|uniref:hypothetical protein n=1 Tax=Nostoc sp. MS1 TaxID=2764711 RepID=UPI001CC5F7F1|nr:hypothetical protein [Nostoc sp. MS1]BCL40038.1 hypothetical protein NSMS1_64850 [Nostoc sp. MS1]